MKIVSKGGDCLNHSVVNDLSLSLACDTKITVDHLIDKLYLPLLPFIVIVDSQLYLFVPFRFVSSNLVSLPSYVPFISLICLNQSIDSQLSKHLSSVLQ